MTSLFTNKERREELFIEVFNCLSEYGGDNKKQADWALKIYNSFNPDGAIKRILRTIGSTDRGQEFIYAVTFSRIITNFTKIVNEDHYSVASSEKTIYFDDLGLTYQDIECYLEDVSTRGKKRVKDRGGFCVADIGIAIGDYTQEIYGGAINFYINQGSSDPQRELYNSLVSLFDKIDEETGETIEISMPIYNEQRAYSFVMEKFRY